LLESLHSALIDELTERHPKPKPELGMPQRHRTLAMPAAGKLDALICEASFVLAEPAADGSRETRGFALLAIDEAAAAKLKCDAAKLWASLIKRAGREFGFRNIQPRLSDVRALPGPDIPPGFIQPSRVIWIPFKLGAGSAYLGVGA
jgi:hypothetical protein